MKHIYLFFFLCVLLESCAPICETDLYFKIYNDSMDTIAYIRDIRSFIPERPAMFDSLPEEKTDLQVIKPNDYFYDYIVLPKKHFYRFPDGKTKMYILSLDTLNKYTWEEIRASSNYMKRYELNADDIIKLRCEIRFP